MGRVIAKNRLKITKYDVHTNDRKILIKLKKKKNNF